ncbi:MAG TPA: DUF2268 domain-containing putative Zn-dependent protease, partial [Chitinophagaceae bacterium]|nr:DUF2268 domain-containing putative Zn-dependent protease [Chitinophagaceae bacterium]
IIKQPATLMKHTLAICTFILLVIGAHGQDVDRIKHLADSLSDANPAAAATLYVKEAGLRNLKPYIKQAYVNASYMYASIDKLDSAVWCLQQAVYNYRFVNKGFILTDPVMQKMKNNKGYDAVVSYLNQKEIEVKNPEAYTIHTGDIDLFWKAYDAFLKDTAHAEDIFNRYYFNTGSGALQDYYRVKISSTKKFAATVKHIPGYLAGIRANTLAINNIRSTIKTIYSNLHSLYDGAHFPDLYFVVGAFSSGGTSNDYGLVVGADMYAKNKSTNTSELSLWQKNNSAMFANLPYTVAHELVHFQQGGMADDTTLLHAVLVEGMADFIGELISGHTANQRLQIWAKGRERQIWQDFVKEMYLNRAYNWIANSSQETKDKPADLGYWVGYQICKAYYNNSPNKKLAITDMLNIKDYRAFYVKSGVEEYIHRL